MAGAYFFVFLLILGVAQCEPIGRQDPHAEIEDLRAGQRIVYGWEAAEGQIPHQISLRMIREDGQVSSCGGSLIHHEWVITAAHCLANRLTFVVRLGLTNLTRPEYIVETSRKYIHPQYIEIQAGVQTDDIALLGLESPIPYGPNIQPCRLQNSEKKNFDYTGVRLTVSGYGRTDDLWNGGAASEILLWVYQLGVSNEECLRWYPNSRVIREQTICAAAYNQTGQSSCQGDSGGPLTELDVDGKPTMVGVVSFGHAVGCNSPHPSGLVRPGHYHDWFELVTGISFDWKNEDLQPVEPESSEFSESSESSESSEENGEGDGGEGDGGEGDGGEGDGGEGDGGEDEESRVNFVDM